MPSTIAAEVEAVYKNGKVYTDANILGSDKNNGNYYTIVLKIPFSETNRIPASVTWRIRITNSYAGSTMTAKEYCYAWWGSGYATANGGDFISGKGTTQEGTISTGSVSSGSSVYSSYATREFNTTSNTDRYLCIWGLNAETVYSCAAYRSSNFEVTYEDEGSVEEFEWTYEKNQYEEFNLTDDEWNDFTDKINEKRISMNLSEWSFEKAYTGYDFTAEMANDARDAIQDMGRRSRRMDNRSRTWR